MISELLTNNALDFGTGIEFAYIGPGGGLSAIGALLAVVVGLMAAVFGFVWYPLKRIMRRKRNPSSSQHDRNAT